MGDAEIERGVREHRFFADMSPSHCAVVRQCTRFVRIPVNQYLFRQGEPASAFYLLRQGRVGLRLPGADDLLLTLGEDEFLGTSWAAPPRRWSYDAIAFEPVSALAVDVARLEDEWEGDHTFGFMCLRRILVIFQSHLNDARMQSLDLYR